jgi:primase-polymerase (primpol)-like protein
MTITGNCLGSGGLIDATDTLPVLAEKYMKRPQTAPARPQHITPTNSADWFEKGIKVDEGFRALYNGYGKERFDSESEADTRLMGYLAYWCNRDREAMLHYFRTSPYMRQKDKKHLAKATNRRDYLPRTADYVIGRTRQSAEERDREYQRQHQYKAAQYKPQIVQQAKPEIKPQQAAKAKKIAPKPAGKQENAQNLILAALKKSENGEMPSSLLQEIVFAQNCGEKTYKRAKKALTDGKMIKSVQKDSRWYTVLQDR